MRLLNILRLRLHSLFHRNRMESELEKELEFHLAEQTAEYMSQGMTQTEAIRAARRAFGPAALLAEQCRDQRRTRWLEDFAADASFALRTLRNAPGFAAAAILTLALGLGANLAFFTAAHGVLLRPLPYPEPARLIEMELGIAGIGPVLALRQFATRAEYAGYLSDVELTAQLKSQAVRLRSAAVTANLTRVLGVQPAIGRWFDINEEVPSQHRVAVLSHRAWRDRLNADPAILGSQVLLNEKPFEIVGVMPPGFAFPSSATELWTPVRVSASDLGSVWGGANLFPIGRLKPDASLAEAQAELRPVIDRIRPLFPWRMPDAWGTSSHLLLHQQALIQTAQPKLLALAAASLLLLLIACGNVANLLLSRWLHRQREFSVRTALGAGRGRLLRQLITENLILASAGGVAGLLSAWALLRLLPVLLPGTPRIDELSLHAGVTALAIGAMFATFALLSLAPMVRAPRPRISDRRTALALSTLQLALATALLIGAGLMGRTLWQLSNVDTGVRAPALTTGLLSVGPSRCASPALCRAFIEDATATLAALPGVRTVNWSNGVPLDQKISAMSVAVDDHPRQPGEPAFVLWHVPATPGYFQALGVPLRAGRAFNNSDGPVAIISESTAKRFWPGQSPIGKRIRAVAGVRNRTIVGVVADVAHYSLAGFPSWVDGVEYVPFEPSDNPANLHFFVESAGQAPPDLQSAIRARFPDAVLSRVTTIDAVRQSSTAGRRSTAGLLALLAAVGLMLSSVGVYGVLRQRVARRTRELGIRIALGATPANIAGTVLREALFVGGAGAAFGAIAAAGLARYLQSLLFGVDAHDPLAFVGGPAVLVVTALAAAAAPTLRAAHIDPLTTLRAE
jgi:predicted permease